MIDLNELLDEWKKIYKDDSQIAQLKAEKVYCDNGDKPRTEIHIEQIQSQDVFQIRLIKGGVRSGSPFFIVNNKIKILNSPL